MVIMMMMANGDSDGWVVLVRLRGCGRPSFFFKNRNVYE